jgi:hypothetical protein
MQEGLNNTKTSFFKYKPSTFRIILLFFVKTTSMNLRYLDYSEM